MPAYLGLLLHLYIEREFSIKESFTLFYAKLNSSNSVHRLGTRFAYLQHK